MRALTVSAMKPRTTIDAATIAITSELAPVNGRVPRPAAPAPTPKPEFSYTHVGSSPRASNLRIRSRTFSAGAQNGSSGSRCHAAARCRTVDRTEVGEPHVVREDLDHG